MEFLQTWQQKQWGDSVQHEKISAKDLDVIGEFSHRELKIRWRQR